MSIHVTTFYSFKGGVGRTQALVNCAAWIACHQRPEAGHRPKVLMIDFDLEASGIQFVEGLTIVEPRPGIVDFIHDYLDHAGEVPDISNYVSQAILPNGVQVDVILAGDQSRYYRRFGQLRFDALWQRQHGSALFLDMKNQLDELGYEFMLIDSRTGLCDTSELCTLTLPDQVVVVFAPNRQNLAGTRLVIERIRQNPLVNVIGVASRIRKTDDEHGGLRSVLAEFERVFEPQSPSSKWQSGYPWLVVHEDPQQRILSDAIAVVSYPRSGLAREYRRIARRIVARNPRSAHWVAAICADAPERSRISRRYGIVEDELDAWRKAAKEAALGHPGLLWSIAKAHPKGMKVRGAGGKVAYVDGTRMLGVDVGLGFGSLIDAPVPDAIRWLLDCLEAGQLEYRLFHDDGCSSVLRDTVTQAFERVLTDESLAPVRAESLRYWVWTRSLHDRTEYPEIRAALRCIDSFRDGACLGGFCGQAARAYIMECGDAVGVDWMSYASDECARRWVRSAALDSRRSSLASQLLQPTSTELQYLSHWISWACDLLFARTLDGKMDRTRVLSEIEQHGEMLDQLRSFWLPGVSTVDVTSSEDVLEGPTVVEREILASRGCRPTHGEAPLWMTMTSGTPKPVRLSDSLVYTGAYFEFLEISWFALVPSAAAILRAMGEVDRASELERDALERLRALHAEEIEDVIVKARKHGLSMRGDWRFADVGGNWPYTCGCYSPIHRTVIDVAGLLAALRGEAPAPTYVVQHSRSLPSPRVAYSRMCSIGSPMRDWGGWSGIMDGPKFSRTSVW